jgi:DNA mismatch repair ATPase MutL
MQTRSRVKSETSPRKRKEAPEETKEDVEAPKKKMKKSRSKKSESKAQKPVQTESKDEHKQTKPSVEKKSKTKAEKKSKKTKTERKDSKDRGKIVINRAPVLTLWVAVVANRLGHDWKTALTMGKLIAGWFAQAKGRSIGMMEPSERTAEEREERRGEYYNVSAFGRQIPVRDTTEGPRAIASGKPISSSSVDTYLQKAFGDNLQRVKDAMTTLAASYDSAEQLNKDGYDLYTKFRPDIPAGTKGWGRKGELSLDTILALAND